MKLSVVVAMLSVSAFLPVPSWGAGRQEVAPAAESVVQQALQNFERQRFAEVVRELEPFVRVSPFNAAAQHLLGLAYLKTNETAKGIKALQISADLAPQNPAFALNLAKAYLGQGETGKAREVLEKAVSARETPELCRMLGLVYLDLEKGEDAFGFFERASRLNPKDPVSWYYMGLTHHAYNHFEAAVECYQNAIKLDPSDFQSHFQLGKLFESLQKWQEAAAELEAAEKLVKDSGDLYTHLCAVYLRTNKLNEALQAGQKAVALLPTDPLAHYHLGKALSRLGRQAEAREHLRLIDSKATELEPTLSEEWEKRLKPEKPR